MVKRILAEAGEACEVDVDILHNTLCDLPAEKYLDLFHKMQMKIYGYPSPFANFGCGTLENTDDNAKYYGEQPKVTKSYAVGGE